MNKQQIFDKITNSIIEKLKEGVLPWRKSWKTGIPANYFSKRFYNGINFLYLSLLEYPKPYYLTYLQCKQLDGFINKSEEGFLVIFWKISELPNSKTVIEETLNSKKFPLLRYSYVFNISQTSLYTAPDEGLKIIPAESVISNLIQKPVIVNNFRNCSYNLQKDIISIPVITDFYSTEEYYSSLFHELIHWTGRSNRLNRNMSHEKDEYAIEELIAEIGASYLCGLCSIAPKVLDNQVSYIDGWLKSLSNDRNLLIKASLEAKRAVNYLIGKSGEENADFQIERATLEPGQ